MDTDRALPELHPALLENVDNLKRTLLGELVLYKVIATPDENRYVSFYLPSDESFENAGIIEKRRELIALKAGLTPRQVSITPAPYAEVARMYIRLASELNDYIVD